MPKMTRRKKTEEHVEPVVKPEPLAEQGYVKEDDVVEKPKRKASLSKQETPSVPQQEFYFKAMDDFEKNKSYLVCQSNHGSDHKDRTLSNARSKKLKKPILIEINSDLKFPNFSLTVEEAKQLRDTLSDMIDYLESV